MFKGPTSVSVDEPRSGTKFTGVHGDGGYRRCDVTRGPSGRRGEYTTAVLHGDPTSLSDEGSETRTFRPWKLVRVVLVSN